MLVLWERYGKGEEAHAIMEVAMAGGWLPSGRFGANASRWDIMIVALNLHQTIKPVVLAAAPALTARWTACCMKTLRFDLIHLPGVASVHARELIVCIAGTLKDVAALLAIGRRIAALAALPSG